MYYVDPPRLLTPRTPEPPPRVRHARFSDVDAEIREDVRDFLLRLVEAVHLPPPDVQGRATWACNGFTRWRLQDLDDMNGRRLVRADDRADDRGERMLGLPVEIDGDLPHGRLELTAPVART